MPALAMPLVSIAVPAAQTLIATVPNNTEWLANLRIANNTGAAVSIQIWVVPAGGAVGAGTLVSSGYVIPANDARYPLEGVQLPAGASIYAGASAAGALQALLHGTGKSTA